MPTVREILERSQRGGLLASPPTPGMLVPQTPVLGAGTQFTQSTELPDYKATIVPMEALPRDPASGLVVSREAILNPDQEWIDRDKLSAEMRGPLGKVFDFLNIGLYPTANVVKYILEGRTDLANAFWRGLTMQERTTFTDILEKYNVPGAPIIGFVLDVGLDVNTYINYGIPALMKLGKVAINATKNVKAVNDAIDIIKQNSVLHWVDEAFGTTITRSADFRKYKEVKLFRTAALSADKRALVDEIERYVRTIPVGIRKVMSYMAENPDEAPLLLSKLKPNELEVYETVSHKLGEFLTRGQEIGLLSSDITKEALAKYFPHRYVLRETRYGTELIGPLFTPSLAKQRKFETLEDVKGFLADMRQIEQAKTLEEAVAYAQEHGLYNGFGESIFKHNNLDLVKRWAREVQRVYTPVEDFVVAYGLYANEFLMYEHKKAFIEDVLNRFGKRVSIDIEVSPEGYGFFMPRGNLRFFQERVAKAALKPDEAARTYQHLSTELTKLAEEAAVTGRIDPHELVELPAEIIKTIVGVTTDVPVYILEKDIARDLNNTLKFFVGDDATRGLLRFYDKVLGTWKMLATAWRLPYHLRNAMTNPIMMWLGGTDPRDMPELASIATRIMRQTDDVITLGGVKRTAKEWYQVAQKLGTVKTGFFGETSEDILIRMNELFQGKLRGKIDELLSLPNEVGATIENHARLMMFTDGLRKGLDEHEATRRVWKYLFNYDDVTPFETNLKRLVPFYTWLRKNLPLQLEVLTTDPRKMAKVGRAFTMVERLSNLSYEDVATSPEWRKRLGYVKLPWQDSRGRDMWAYIDVPMKDLSLLANPAELVNSLTPLVGLVAAAVGIEPFPIYTPREEPRTLERFPGELEPAPAFAVWLPEGVQRFFGITPMVDTRTGKTTLGWPKKSRAVLQTILPPLRELNEMTKDWFVNVEPNDAPWRRLSFLTGIRFTPVDRKEQLYYWWLDQQNKIGQVSKKMYQLGRALTKEELEAILKQ